MRLKNKETKVALFEGKEVRKVWHNDDWWFVINDAIEILTDSSDPAQYFKRLKERDTELAKLTDKGGVQFVPPLMLIVETQGGKQKMYCWNTEGILRLIQSIPSPKAEPFKRWLAKEGIRSEYQGLYATPFSIYKDSSERIIVFEINKQRFILDKTNPSYKDPAAVIGSHCYSLTEYEGRQAKGYAYFKIVSDMEMKMKYDPTGTCPSEFPENGSVVYYR